MLLLPSPTAQAAEAGTTERRMRIPGAKPTPWKYGNKRPYLHHFNTVFVDFSHQSPNNLSRYSDE